MIIQSDAAAHNGDAVGANGKATRASRAETRDRILRRLRATGRATVRELADELGVSTVTIHRHLADLEEQGAIARPRGAAQLLRGATMGSADFVERLASRMAAKEAIARHAVDFLPHRAGAIFLDGSTTCLCLAREIARSATAELTIVTTSPALLYEISCRNLRVIALPGELDQLARVIGGPWTVEFLSTLNVQAAFISGIGLTLDAGLTSQRRAIGDVLKEVVARCAETYMLVDSSKFGRTALLHIAWPWQATAVITDGGLSPESAAEYRARGVNLLIAETPARASP